MPDPTTARPTIDGVATLANVVELLEATARSLWANAKAEGPFGASYTFAQDVYLTAGLAAGLMPDGVQIHRPIAPAVDVAVPLAALCESESLLRSVPVDALPSGTSQLLVRLADLIREVRA